MKRKVFEEKGFEVEGRVLPLDRFSLFCDRKEGFYVCPEYRAAMISEAEKLMDKCYPALELSGYLMFRRDGNRNKFETPYFERRRDLMTLVLAEYVEREGRFADKICNLVWMILEETTWVVPAHSRLDSDALSYGVEKIDYIDLFSAGTGAALAVAYYFCGELLDKAAPAIGQRLLYELDRRIIRPYLDESCHHNDWWMGRQGKSTNNWCPWINSNVLTVCALTVKDTAIREAVVKTAMRSLDSFIGGYHEDGGCDEGPHYWGVAGGALFNACLVLYDMTDGYVDIFRDPLIVNMCEYIAKVNVSGDYYLTFSDSHAKRRSNSRFGYDWAVLSGSQMAQDFWSTREFDATTLNTVAEYNTIYRHMRQLGISQASSATYQAPMKVWLDGLCVAVTRENRDGSGLYLAIKGGHNAESHNHNDVGNFVVYADGEPLFLDAGVGEYTRRTFSKDRYSIWSMRSDHHNLATFCGVTQMNGRDFCATDVAYDEKTGGLSMELSHAYPSEACLAGYRREAKLVGGVVSISDIFELKQEGDVTFSLICRQSPEKVEKGRFVLGGRKVDFDPSLTFAYEAIDCSDVETRNLPREWNTPALYRITLSANGLAGNKEHRYELKIS